ncbi:glutamate-1-semialdehyde 2,1-aminomutase [Pajaroellobacter abortibovis]|uniref:Glutamate-1-semialdehyde 2,1-aminomutase n=1 Tax=Pajaroellobacter abortibovis TaxID=1882918 RepID=A0A1L6MWE0_9BACT|nr:glutamate-1-semialdehyde 2,1-aminomutase [Pajaroellobacter abortibovis]APR99852.1 glutamate-1-semialdehyde-2,1-aminomutase [Pajaroellobacter abortibovis]
MALLSSSQWFARAKNRMPGGVNSPVRAFQAVGGEPPFIVAAEGAMVISIEGQRYTDYVGSWGSMIVGHAHPAVVQAVTEAAAKGMSFGALTVGEVQFSERIASLYPSIQMLRIVSSGTEATMAAIRVARGYTGRDIIVKFEGCYHGHADCLLVKAGSGAATLGVPNSAGVPASTVQHTRTLPYHDRAALRTVFATIGHDIAAVIVEPAVGNMGCIPPDPEFLQEILKLTKEYGAVSIFDEVMTGCRVSPSGVQGLFNFVPDLTCLGKIIGGGLPLAAYGGRRDIMEKIAPLGPVYQAGTLSGNPVAVSAGMATLAFLQPSLYQYLEELGAQLEQGINKLLPCCSFPLCFQRIGSMFTLFFGPGPIRNWSDASRCDTERFGRWHQAMLEQKQYWPPSQFEAAFLSSAHTPELVEKTLAAIWIALQKVM